MNELLVLSTPLLAPAFSWAGSDISWLEIVALLLALAMVVCNLRVNPIGWPLAIASSVLYGLLFLHSKLYGEAALQLVFIELAAWGWWQWLCGTADGARLQVRTLTPRQRWATLAITLAAWPLLGATLARITDSDVPYLDALPTVGSLAGQYLLGRKWVDNWPVWVAVNLVSVLLFAVKALFLTALLYALFALLALLGWRAWANMQSTAKPNA
jgi:nicotinamide mononucleotide transporter